MKFSLEAPSDANQIHAYDDDFIVIRTKNNTGLLRVDNSLILTSNQVITDLPINDLTQLSSRDITYLKSLAPEVLILVQGSDVHLSAQTRVQFSELAIGVECMSLGAACRTYNLLVAEGRQVVLLINFEIKKSK